MELLGKSLNVIISTFVYKPYLYLKGQKPREGFIWKGFKIISPPFIAQFPFMYFI